MYNKTKSVYYQWQQLYQNIIYKAANAVVVMTFLVNHMNFFDI